MIKSLCRSASSRTSFVTWFFKFFPIKKFIRISSSIFHFSRIFCRRSKWSSADFTKITIFRPHSHWFSGGFDRNTFFDYKKMHSTATIEKGFQIDSDRIALLANQIDARWKSANQGPSLKHQFESPSEQNHFYGENFCRQLQTDAINRRCRRFLRIIFPLKIIKMVLLGSDCDSTAHEWRRFCLSRTII